MKVLIVEDELLAAQRLQLMIGQYDPSIRDIYCTESVGETVAWLRQHPAPDLILSDIQLSDGHSFDIFRRIAYKGPVVFTTAYDQYAMEAFRLFSIDYILKPVTADALAQAFHKYKEIVTPAIDYQQVLPRVQQVVADEGFKSRFLGRIGQRLQFVQAEDVSFFQADNKIVYLTDKQGVRYLIDYTLEKLEQLLNPKLFFRLNRRYIVRYSAIEYIKPHLNSRLKLEVKGAGREDEFIISRERVAEFRTWAEA
ncbi:LytR/AlgR family response regulator transcription factor [Paraflavitalea pollutisoli]|uniref:LytR/AlgR family response regulator transcription factor n=1 Tax=Paraflavitalea pollutisoli TaxID=3034143 RepID=UPI0023EC0928|nr:LytTR family DNA-binding domain-containing protein [Paraflavitalea sp. H1-2-19X]